MNTETDMQRCKRLNTPSPGMELIYDASGFPVGEVPAMKHDEPTPAPEVGSM